MTWFKVDDTFHSHNKIRKVLADDPAALALWVVAGSWSSANLTDGLIPDHQLPWLYPADPESLARKLVAARLWRRVRGGYQFHDWEQCNPTAEQVLAVRHARAEAGRKGGRAGRRSQLTGQDLDNEGLTSEQDLSIGEGVGASTNRAPRADLEGHTQGVRRSKRQANAEAIASANGKQNRTPSRPVPPPSKEGGTGGARHAAHGAASAPQPPPQAPNPDDDIPTWRSMPPIGQLSDEQRQLNSDRAAEARAALARPATADESADEPAWTVETTGGTAVIGVPDDYDPDARWEGRAAVNILPFRPRTA